MRMWMVQPKIMCRKHLLGEHVEIHMFVSTINSGKKIDGYLANNLLQPYSLHSRHEELSEEMLRRGYKHVSPIDDIQFNSLTEIQYGWKIDNESAQKELLSRCPDCFMNYLRLSGVVDVKCDSASNVVAVESLT